MLPGRQSMRSLHFIFAWGLFGFLVLHVALVLLAQLGHRFGQVAGITVIAACRQ